MKNRWLHFFSNYLHYIYYRLFNKSKIFKFQGHYYIYFDHKYNTTLDNERSIEIPIICKFLSENNGVNILEIGNVLSHYFNFDHDIVDKYEKSEGVINEDVVDFQTSKNYSLIISISTLEHVGWDEDPRDPEKIFEALNNLKNFLAPGGKLVITIPIGYNSILDKYLETGRLKFTENYYLKRISQREWVEINTGFYQAKYASPFQCANLMFFGVYQRKS